MRLIKLKRFIKEFNFPDPEWNNLPEGFPNCDKQSLTKEESHLLEAIEMAWMLTEKGRTTLYKKFLRLSFVVIAISTIALLGINILTNPEGKYTKSVNAATISAQLMQNLEGAIESTRSAIFNSR